MFHGTYYQESTKDCSFVSFLLPSIVPGTDLMSCKQGVSKGQKQMGHISFVYLEMSQAILSSAAFIILGMHFGYHSNMSFFVIEALYSYSILSNSHLKIIHHQ